ncbi:hypothetical protein ACFX15_009391 [Malus domestica]
MFSGIGLSWNSKTSIICPAEVLLAYRRGQIAVLINFSVCGKYQMMRFLWNRAAGLQKPGLVLSGLQSDWRYKDMDRTVSQRSEPSSRELVKAWQESGFEV